MIITTKGDKDMNISPRTPQERLEIREFILDSNLFLIANSLYSVVGIALFFYFVNYLLYETGKLDVYMYVVLNVIFALQMFFAYLAQKSILTQRKYIARLESVFDEIQTPDELAEQEKE